MTNKCGVACMWCGMYSEYEGPSLFGSALMWLLLQKAVPEQHVGMFRSCRACLGDGVLHAQATRHVNLNQNDERVTVSTSPNLVSGEE